MATKLDPQTAPLASGPPSAFAGSRSSQWSYGPWLWGPRLDLSVFLGSAVVALGLAALAPRLGVDGGALPTWGFLVFVVMVDVAHVYATLYRTYFDRAELAKRPILYTAVPLGCFAIGTLIHSYSSLLFWTVLAYVALTHFIRQQVGWVAIYRARAGDRTRMDRVIDDAAIYVATLYPVLVWHASLPRAFEWFVEGDFIAISAANTLLPVARVLYIAVLAAYFVRAWFRAARTKKIETGKHVVVATTAATWYVGIVATNSDFAFTVANVIVHGVPYVVFLWMYTREKAKEPRGLVGAIARRGIAVFASVLMVIAFVEEMVWDRLVWHSHEGLFGWVLPEQLLSKSTLSVMVPLLAMPQATHYVLDAVLWRRRDTGQAQARAMGFAQKP